MSLEYRFPAGKEALSCLRYDVTFNFLRRMVDGFVAVYDVPRRRIQREVTLMLKADPKEYPPGCAEYVSERLFEELYPDIQQDGVVRYRVLLKETVLEEAAVAVLHVGMFAACGGEVARWAVLDRTLFTCRFASMRHLNRVFNVMPMVFPPSPAAEDVAAYAALPIEERVRASALRGVGRELARNVFLLQRCASGLWSGALSLREALTVVACQVVNLGVEVGSRVVATVVCERFALPHAAECMVSYLLHIVAAVAINSAAFVGVRNRLAGCALLQTRDQASFWPWGENVHGDNLTPLPYLTQSSMKKIIAQRGLLKGPFPIPGAPAPERNPSMQALVSALKNMPEPEHHDHNMADFTNPDLD